MSVEKGVIGLSKEKLLKPSIRNRIVAGAALAGGDWFLNRSIDGLSIAGAATGFMEPLIKSHPMVVLGLIAGTFTVGAGLNAFQNVRLLREERIGVSTNALATVAFHSMDKKWPSKTRLRDMSVTLGQVFSKEHLLIAPAVFNEMALAGLVANAGLKTSYNLIKAGVSEVALRTARRKEKVSKHEREKVPNSGLIFVPRLAAAEAAVGD